LKILASLHLQPLVKELSTALQANIAALILAMITVSPNLLSAEFSNPGHRSADGVKGRVRGEGEPCPLQVDRL